MVEQDELLEMLPCSHCKNEKPHLVSCRPEGRTADLWRVECPDPVVRVQDRGCPPLEQVYDQYEGIACRFRIPASSEGRSDLRGEALRESVSATQKSLVT